MNNVPTGYKQTEVGVIPEDWEIKPLGEIGESLIGLTYKPTDVRPDGILVLRSSNIRDGSLRFDDNVFVCTEVPERIMVRKGDILICVRNGSRDLIGKCAKIDERAIGMTFGAFMAVFRTPFYRFGYHQFQSQLIQRQIREHLGATINQITNKSLNSFCIPLPPTLAEQEAIAGALSDSDALIESLEQLIAKKRRIKQGAMQELLTGRKRLPGFSGEWEMKRLGDECELITKGTTPTSIGKDFTDNGIRFIKVESLDSKGRLIDDKVAFIDEETDRLLKRSQLKEGDLLISIAGALGRVGIVDNDILPANTNQALAIVRFKSNSRLNLLYVFHFLGINKIKKHIQDTSVQGAQANLSLQNIADLTIDAPNLSEQTAIAAVLSDMDTEIASLEGKLAKVRQLKQGMMQELLTGRIRLI